MIFTFYVVAGGLPSTQIGMDAVKLQLKRRGRLKKKSFCLYFLLADDPIDRSGQDISADGVVCIKALRGGY